MTKNPDSIEMNKFFDSSFENLLGEFVTASGALRNAQKYKGANANADYLSFCNDRVNLIMTLLQYYKKKMSENETKLNQQLKYQRTPEQVLDVIRTYLKNIKFQLEKEDIEIMKKGACKNVRFNPQINYQEHPNSKANSTQVNSSQSKVNSSKSNSTFYKELGSRYGGKKYKNKKQV